MILHLAEDEKFIDYIIDIFEKIIPDKNIYLINSNSINFKYIKSNNYNIYAFEYETKNYMEILLNKYDAIIFHNLIHPYKWEIINNLNINTKIHWMVWGADLYIIPKLRKKLFQEKTQKFISKNLKHKQKITNNIELLIPGIYNLFYKLLKHNKTQNSKYLDSLKKITSISTVIPPEFYIIKKHLNRKAFYIPFKYGSLSTLITNMPDKICTKHNFWIGNSGYPSNNHLEVFSHIVNNNINKYNVYTPLSYGDKEYSSHIESIGYKIFNNNFIPIKKFISLSEYSNILHNCGNVIMNHNRQQGMGNIIISLWFGAKLYLNKTNPIYSFFKEKGIKFFDIKEINKFYNKNIYNELVSHNRPILQFLYNEEKVYFETENLIKQLIS